MKAESAPVASPGLPEHSPRDYRAFIARKSQMGGMHGFKPIWMPSYLKDFQAHSIDWALRKGRGAILADCGLGKTLDELVFAENVVRKTNGRFLLATPLAVSHQTKREAEKFGIEAYRSQDGKFPSTARTIITNYERLEHFDPADFNGFICDESSILKSFDGSTRKIITRFMLKMPYRLLATATAAPNDYVELGTSSEALGELSHSDMLRRFFQQLDDKGQKRETEKQEQAEKIINQDPSYFQKLAYRIAQTIGQWRLKHHAVTPFWRWVASWALAYRMPSDIGFSDDGYVLPELIEREHVIDAGPAPDMLFTIPAFGLAEERAERRRTMKQRCEFVATLVNHDRSAVAWCDMNAEGDLLEKIIPGAEQIAGRTPDERKTELFEAFASGQLKKLVTKKKIGAFGLNWQHCNHVVSFVSHSYEQDYQLVRRCWRFGQRNPVTVDRVATTGEARVIGNLKRKAERARLMFEALVREMRHANRIESIDQYTMKEQVPTWL